jgi:hypothetical protein
MLRALDSGYEVPLPMHAGEPAVPVGPLCSVPFGLTSAVYVGRRRAETRLF